MDAKLVISKLISLCVKRQDELIWNVGTSDGTQMPKEAKECKFEM
jgi:hypothetical protein